MFTHRVSRDHTAIDRAQQQFNIQLVGLQEHTIRQYREILEQVDDIQSMNAANGNRGFQASQQAIPLQTQAATRDNQIPRNSQGGEEEKDWRVNGDLDQSAQPDRGQQQYAAVDLAELDSTGGAPAVRAADAFEWKKPLESDDQEENIMNLITKTEKPKAVSKQTASSKVVEAPNQAQNDSFSNILELQGGKDQKQNANDVDFYEASGGQKNHSFMEYGDEAEAVGATGAQAPSEAKETPLPGADLKGKNDMTDTRVNNYLDEPEGEALDEEEHAGSHKSYEEDIKDLQRTLGHLEEPGEEEASHNPFKE